MHVTLGTLVLTKALKTRLQAAQNECVRFCLKLGDRKRITVKELKKNKLPTNSRCILYYIYKPHAKKAPNYMDEIYFPCRVQQNSYTLLLSKTKAPHRKTNQSLIGPLFWNNQDNFWETSASSNAFKHNIKDYYFRKGN